MTSPAQQIETMGRRARRAAALVGAADDATKRRWLLAMADGLAAAESTVAAANAADVDDARADGLADALVDRLALTPARHAAMVEGVRRVADLPDPVGTVLDTTTRPNGLEIRRVRVPLGVVAMIYESRPNVTADAAALCVRAGNAAILRGGSEALRSNRAILDALVHAGVDAGLPKDALQLVSTTDHAAVTALLQLERYIDLVIPRGGEGLIRAVTEQAHVPVLKHYKGVCHVYVDRAADLEKALAIVVNAKCQRPGVCNAMETLLVHADVAETFLPRVAAVLRERGVELRGCEHTRAAVPDVAEVTRADWSTEYLDLVLSIGVMHDLDAALEHIDAYGSRHTDVIVTEDAAAAEAFTAGVDSAVVMVNASSRFNDGHEFGLGAEIGISTDKLHARGPCGLEALTTYKYVVRGDGQVRD